MIFCFEGNLEISVQGQEAFRVAETAFINNFDRPYDVILRGNLSVFHIRFKPNSIHLTPLNYRILNHKNCPK